MRQYLLLKCKNPITINTVTVSVLLPDASRIVCVLPEAACPKVGFFLVIEVLSRYTNLVTMYIILKALYEVVFAKSTLSTPFSLFTRVGHHLVEAKTSGTLSGVVSTVLIAEASTGTESDLLEFFFEQVINVCYAEMPVQFYYILCI